MNAEHFHAGGKPASKIINQNEEGMNRPTTTASEVRRFDGGCFLPCLSASTRSGTHSAQATADSIYTKYKREATEGENERSLRELRRDIKGAKGRKGRVAGGTRVTRPRSRRTVGRVPEMA